MKNSVICILSILQIIFITCKLTDTLGIGSWSEWLVLAPMVAIAVIVNMQDLGFLNVLQVVFIIGKLTDTLGIGSWSWWLVFAPMIFGLGFVDMYFTCLRNAEKWKK